MTMKRRIRNIGDKQLNRFVEYDLGDLVQLYYDTAEMDIFS